MRSCSLPRHRRLWICLLAVEGTLFSNAWNSQKIMRRSPGGPACAMQGRSLVPLLEGRSKSWREDFYHEFTWTADGRIAPSEGIRSARWKYNRYFSQSPVVEQLFDLQADPGESVDLSVVPDHAARLDEMRTKVETYRAALSRPKCPGSCTDCHNPCDEVRGD